MDTHQVMKCEQIIRDDMIKYLNALKSISSIVNDHQMGSGDRIQAIKHVCKVSLPNP